MQGEREREGRAEMLTGFERLCDQYEIVSVKPLLKGWSGDKKYILENGDGERYVLRLSNGDLYEKKKNKITYSSLLSFIFCKNSSSFQIGIFNFKAF